MSVLPVVLFCLGCVVPMALEVLHSSLPKVPCLSLTDGDASRELAVRGREGVPPLTLLGEGRPPTLL